MEYDEKRVAVSHTLTNSIYKRYVVIYSESDDDYDDHHHLRQCSQSDAHCDDHHQWTVMMINISAHCDDDHQCTVSLYLKLSRGQRIKSSAQGQCSGGDFNHDDDHDDDDHDGDDQYYQYHDDQDDFSY